MEIRILDARDDEDRRAWKSLLTDWPAAEVFAHPSYVSLFAKPTERPLAAVATAPGAAILYPFVLREVDAPHLAAAVPGARDTTSPYGYGGAFVRGDARGLAAEFWEKLAEWQRSMRVVTEFVRMGLIEEQLLPYSGEREQKLTNVVRDVGLDEEAIWRDYDHKVRKNVNKAKRSGVTTEMDPRGERLDDFLRIYESTMDRREARADFYFPRSFFETIINEMEGWFTFIHAKLEGRIISTELALVSGESVYSYLGGTDIEYSDYRPNDLLKHDLVLWTKAQGKKRFIFGGGYAPDDGIFRYKRAFAPEGLVPYFVGRRVLDAERFASLVRAHEEHARATHPEWSANPGFFPAYRAALPT